MWPIGSSAGWAIFNDSNSMIIAASGRIRELEELTVTLQIERFLEKLVRKQKSQQQEDKKYSKNMLLENAEIDSIEIRGVAGP